MHREVCVDSGRRTTSASASTAEVFPAKAEAAEAIEAEAAEAAEAIKAEVAEAIENPCGSWPSPHPQGAELG